jgi:hypothetical protein
VAKGQRGAAIDVPPRTGLLFHPTTPRLVCCNNFKDATKPAATQFDKMRDIPRQSKETGLTRQTVYRIKGDPAGAEGALAAWGM